jgi:microcystin-dependent protein
MEPVPFLGDIRLFAFPGDPRHWDRCAGQSMLIQDNPALFSLLGTNFGGNGQTTFQLPTLAGPNGNSPPFYHIALQGVFPSKNVMAAGAVPEDGDVAPE